MATWLKVGHIKQLTARWINLDRLVRVDEELGGRMKLWLTTAEYHHVEGEAAERARRYLAQAERETLAEGECAGPC